MNYYYPYFNMPYQAAKVGTKTGLKGLISNIKWGSIINGTQKTLNIVNQTIPLIKQAKPVINNAKTMFKLMSEFKKVDTPINIKPSNSINVNQTNNINTNQVNNIEEIKQTSSVGPTFFA